MTRKFARPRAVSVLEDSEGQPRTVAWGGRREAVRVCNTWRDEGRWWEPRPPRTYFKVVARSRAVLVLYREEGRWYLERVVD